MAYSKSTKTTKNTKSGKKTTTSTTNRMSKRDLEAKRIELEHGNPSVQKKRIEQQGKTSRAKAYSVAAVGSTASVANAADDKTVIYEGMASGGIGTEDAGNVQQPGSGAVTKPGSGVQITQ